MGITAALGALGSIVSAAGSIGAAGAEADAAEYRAAIAERNAKQAEFNAVSAQRRSAVEQQDQDQETRNLLAQQLSAQAGSGLDVGSRSFALARKSAAQVGRKDALNIIREGTLEAESFRVQGEDFKAEAHLQRSAAKSSRLAGFLGATKSLLGGATKFAGSFS